MSGTRDCGDIRQRLDAFLDGELAPVESRALEAHLESCVGCAAEADWCKSISGAFRSGAGAAIVPDAALAEIAGHVVTLASAEAQQSLRSRLAVAFSDMRFVVAVAGACAATCVCAAGLAGMLSASPAARSDSLAALMARIAAPRGSTQNPYSVDPRLVPPAVHQGSFVMPAVLVDDVPYAVRDEQYAFSGVLTSNGRVAGVQMLPGGVIDPRAMELLRSIHDSRFQPARLKDGRPVAVSFVWVHSDVTIKPRKSL